VTKWGGEMTKGKKSRRNPAAQIADKATIIIFVYV